MWNDRDSTQAAAFGWGPVRENIVESVWLSCCALARDHAGCRGNKHAVQRSFISTQRNSLRHPRCARDVQGRRCDGAPPFSETRLWICRRRRRACCERESRAAAADIGGTRPCASARRGCGTRGHHARRRRSSQARRSARGTRARTRARAWAWSSPRLAPWPPLGLAQASLGLASPPALWLAPASLGLASPPLAPPPPLLASPLLVRRFRACAHGDLLGQKGQHQFVEP
jgi:hypothetical protein